MSKTERKRNPLPKKQAVADPGAYGTIKHFISELQINQLPVATKVNVALGLVLLIALVIVAAVPVWSYIERMVIGICNTFISILSSRELLPMRNVDSTENVTVCAIALAVEMLSCFVVVAVSGGFNNMKSDKGE